jgi:hypothetical protein
MVFCTYCGQSFTRDEHLERHILTRKYCSQEWLSNAMTAADASPRHKCEAIQMFYLPYVVREKACCPCLPPSLQRSLTFSIETSYSDITPSMVKTRIRTRFPLLMA